VPGFEAEYDYTYPPGDKRVHPRRPPAAPPPAPAARIVNAQVERGDRLPARSSPRESGNRHGAGGGRRPSHIAADGFDFSKPYESAAPIPVAEALGSDAGKTLPRSEHPHNPRRPVAALLGGLGRK
jgi:ATP-dependent RNA helicase RhlE